MSFTAQDVKALRESTGAGMLDALLRLPHELVITQTFAFVEKQKSLEALQQAGHDVKVINSGVSGDTTAGGLARLDWALADKPDLVLVELGGNDARGEEIRAAVLKREAVLSTGIGGGIAVPHGKSEAIGDDGE